MGLAFWRRHDGEYVGRHRCRWWHSLRLPRVSVLPAEVLERYQADFEARIAAMVVEQKARRAALREPTQEIPVVDLDSGIGGYAHKAGVGRFSHLNPDELDAKADWERKLASRGKTPRSPWLTPETIDQAT